MADERPLPLGTAAVGLQLARSVVHADGRVLLQRDAVLTPTAVQQLQRHGISDVWVVAQEGESAAPPTSRSPAEVRARLAHLFRHQGHDGADRFLFELMLRYRGADIS